MTVEVLQRRMQKRFMEFNARHFGGRLPLYEICVQKEPILSAGGRGYHDRRERRIILMAMSMRQTTETLVHEMAHAATNDHHGPRWLAEMRRLRALGLPMAASDAMRPGVSGRRRTGRSRARPTREKLETSRRPF